MQSAFFLLFFLYHFSLKVTQFFPYRSMLDMKPIQKIKIKKQHDDMDFKLNLQDPKQLEAK
jgi:hypothetical protein